MPASHSPAKVRIGVPLCQDGEVIVVLESKEPSLFVANPLRDPSGVNRCNPGVSLKPILSRVGVERSKCLGAFRLRGRTLPSISLQEDHDPASRSEDDISARPRPEA